MNPVRAEILQSLSQIRPFDGKEREHIAFAKELVSSGKEIFRRIKPNVPNVHLVAYCILIDINCRTILLGDHVHSGLWLPPGGHCDMDELPRTTAQRELMEEMGVEASFLSDEPFFLTLTNTIGLQDKGHSDISFWFLSRADSSKEVHFDKKEFNSVKWFGFNEVPKTNTDPHMSRFISKMIANKI